MNRVTLVRIEWNELNGLTFELLRISVGNFDGTLLGFWLDDNEVVLDVCFFNVRIKSPFI